MSFLVRILFYLLLFVSFQAPASTWEVGVLFLGKSENELFQKDVDRNILELAKIIPRADLSLSIYREFNHENKFLKLSGDRSRTYVQLNDLLFEKKFPQVRIYGEHLESHSTLSLLKDHSQLKIVMSKMFASTNSQKMLVIFGHGSGARGFKYASTIELAENFKLGLIPRLSILWADACYMANIEFLYQIRDAADWFIGSQESEFSSGMPFDTLDQLPGYSSVEVASVDLARRFIESYSFVQKGQQVSNVEKSATTVSVIHLKKMDWLVHQIGQLVNELKKLTQHEREKITDGLRKKWAMEDSRLIDLGGLVLESRNYIRQQNEAWPPVDIQKKLTSPTSRVKLIAPNENDLLVYGFNNWQWGDEKSFRLDKVDERLKPQRFITGQGQSKWPSRSVRTFVWVKPFAPGLNEFNYYFVNPQTLEPTSGKFSIVRADDWSEYLEKDHNSPLRYHAHTEGKGDISRKYMGLNISMPFESPSFIDYYLLDFQKEFHYLD